MGDARDPPPRKAPDGRDASDVELVRDHAPPGRDDRRDLRRDRGDRLEADDPDRPLRDSADGGRRDADRADLVDLHAELRDRPDLGLLDARDLALPPEGPGADDERLLGDATPTRRAGDDRTDALRCLAHGLSAADATRRGARDDLAGDDLDLPRAEATRLSPRLRAPLLRLRRPGLDLRRMHKKPDHDRE